MPATSAAPLPPVFFTGEEDFGDFEFAPPPPPSFSPLTDQTNSNHLVFGTGFDEDDDWGDFVESRNSSLDPVPDQVKISQQAKKVWEKPTGAIPLSIFGEEEDEVVDEKTDLKNFGVSGLKNSNFSSSKMVNGANGLGIKDLIADLYGKAEKEGGGDSGGGDLDDGSWEFKDAESSDVGGEEVADGIQVFVKSGEHIQSLISSTQHNKQDIGDAFSNVPNFFSGAINHEAEGINLENSWNVNLANGDFSDQPSQINDIFFSYSPPAKDGSRLGLGVGEIRDLVVDMGGPAIDGGNDYNGHYSNGMVPDLLVSNAIDDDFDDNSWEFKDALSDKYNGHETEVEIVEKSVRNINRQGLSSQKCNAKQDMDDAHLFLDTSTKVPDLFEGADYHTNFDVINHDVNPPKDLFLSSTNPIKNSLMFGNGNIKDLLDDLYDPANEIHDEHGVSQNMEVNASISASFDGNDDIDESIWEFKDALSDMHNKECNSYEDQGIGNLWENHAQNLFASSIRNYKQESNGLFKNHEEYFIEPTSLTSGAKKSNIFNDLLPLYDEAGQSTVVDLTQKPVENEEGSPIEGSPIAFVNFYAMNSEDNSSENNKIPKTVFLVKEVQDQASTSFDEYQNVTKPIQEDFVDFYFKLRIFSCHLIRCHLDDLKEVDKIGVLSGEDAKQVGLHLEIQAAYDKLQDEVEFSKSTSEGECPSMDDSNNELLILLKKPYFHAFEMEYFLSENISLAKKNLSSAMNLLQHATIVLKLLTVASWEKQVVYITAWSKMLSACVQELEHGAIVWEQSRRANIQKQILSEPQGCQYFISLGEIYRVVEVLSASLTIYKPWLLSNPIESKDLVNITKKCSDFWMDPGLVKAVEVIHKLEDSNKERVSSLLESINFIHNLDISVLQDRLYHHEQPACQLSLLPFETIEEMESVVWSGKNYFVKVANLWTNRISCDPPALPLINVGL